MLSNIHQDDVQTDEVFQFDKKLTSLSVQGATVMAEFEDGTKEIGSMVVG